MADRTVGELPRAADLYDDSLLVIEQQGAAQSLAGRTLRDYARQGVSDYVEAAQSAAAAAQQAVRNVGTAVEDARSARDAAQKAQQGAETAQKAVEDLEVEAEPLRTGEPASVEKTAREGHVLLRFGLPAGPRGDPGNNIQSIQRTAGNGAAGTVDTYTVTLTDGSTTEFYVTNGADGKGAGDMLSRVYDPQGMARDVFAYADALLPVIHAVTLAAGAWTGDAAPYTQTVSVPGVSADEDEQIIQFELPADSLAAWSASGVRCTAQSGGALTFTAATVPEADLRLRVAVQAAKAYEGGST